MRNFFIVLLCICSLVFIANATGGAAAALSANGTACDIIIHDSTTYGGHSDTITATDSMWVVQKFTPKIGFKHVLQLGSATQANDSIEIGVYIDAYDASTKIRRKLVDTLAVLTGQDVVLPFNETVFGTKYSVVLIGLAGNGTAVKLGPIAIFRQFLVDFKKNIVY